MSYTRQYLNGVKDLLDGIDDKEVERFVELLIEAWRGDKRVLLMGNGGSGATASHIVNDLQKCIHLECGKPLKTLCLSDCAPLMMAWANDTEYANVFAPQVECWAEAGDLVIGISGSGNSPNVIRAMEVAKKQDAHTFGLIGFSGGRLVDVVDDSIIVQSENMQQIEDVHMVILHIAFSAMRDRLR